MEKGRVRAMAKKAKKAKQDVVPLAHHEVRELLTVYFDELRVVLRSVNEKFFGVLLHDEFRQLAPIKAEAAALLLSYFSSVFTYPFELDLDWIYVKTLNDRIMDIGCTDKIVNKMIQMAYVERFKPGRFVRFSDTLSPERKDAVFKIVDPPKEIMQVVFGQIFVEPLSGEHRGGMGYVDYSTIELIPDAELV